MERLTKHRPSRIEHAEEAPKEDLFVEKVDTKKKRGLSQNLNATAEEVEAEQGGFIVVEDSAPKLSMRDRVQQSVDRLSASIYMMELSIQNLEKSHLNKGSRMMDYHFAYFFLSFAVLISPFLVVLLFFSSSNRRLAAS